MTLMDRLPVDREKVNRRIDRLGGMMLEATLSIFPCNHQPGEARANLKPTKPAPESVRGKKRLQKAAEMLDVLRSPERVASLETTKNLDMFTGSFTNAYDDLLPPSDSPLSTATLIVLNIARNL